ncbi:hypothetical protein Tco_0514148 [Tanacetum coccineum]
MSPENKAHEMWIAIERLQQGESLNIQDVKTNLFWEFGKFTSHNEESMDHVQFSSTTSTRYGSRYCVIVKQQTTLDYSSTYHKLFDGSETVSRKKFNENHAKRISQECPNPLELVKAWEKHFHDHFRAPTALDMEVLIKTCLMPLAIKTQNDSFSFVHELKQEMHVDLKYVESLENEIDELESDKAEFSNMYDILLHECVSNDVMCSYLHSLSNLDAHTALQCLYLHKVKECECLAQKLSKQTETVKQMKNDTICKEKESNVFQKEHEQYFEIQDLKAQLQDKNIAISELKKLIEKNKGKGVDTNFEKQSILGKLPLKPIKNQLVVRQPTAYKSERSQLPRHRIASQVGVSHDLIKPVTPHSWPQVSKSSFVKPYDVNAPGPFRNSPKHVSFQTPRESVGSNDMVHNYYYLEEAKKKAQL